MLHSTVQESSSNKESLRKTTGSSEKGEIDKVLQVAGRKKVKLDGEERERINTRSNNWGLGAFQDEVEIHCNGNSMESMRATIERLLLMVEIGLNRPSSVTCQVEGLGHKPSHKIFDVSIVLPAQCTGTRA